MMDDLICLIPSIIETRDANGWNKTTPKNMGLKLACIFCEIDELERALEACDRVGSNRGRWDHVAEELADITMYAMSILHDQSPRSVTLRGNYATGHRQKIFASPYSLMVPMRRHTAVAFEKWRRDQIVDSVIATELIVLEAARLAYLLDIDLPDQVRSKNERNRNRPKRHGGKHPDT